MYMLLNYIDVVGHIELCSFEAIAAMSADETKAVR